LQMLDPGTLAANFLGTNSQAIGYERVTFS
jgi:hypothetical protein